MWMKTRPWVTTLGRLALVLAAGVGLLLTWRSEQANQAAVKADQDRIDRLQKQLSGGRPERQDSLQQQIDLTKAQLELDQDDLEDLKCDLIPSGADRLSRIQPQFARHEAAQHEFESSQTQQTPSSKPEAVDGAGLAQFSAWNGLRHKARQLQQALDEAKQASSTLKQAHDALHTQVVAEAPSKLAIAQQAKSQADAAPASGSNSADGTAAAITSLHHISVDQKDLSDFDKRIQDQDDLATAYGNWIDLVKGRQQSLLHGMIEVLMLILIVLFAVYLTCRLVDHSLSGSRWRVRVCIPFAE